MTYHAMRSPFGRLIRQLAVTALPAVVLLGIGCSDPFIPDYNNPQLPSVIPSIDQLQNQVTGLVAGDREQHAFFILVLETMGRDAYRIDGADPRLSPGMGAISRIAVDRVSSAMVLPDSAIFRKSGRTVVYVLRGSRFEETPVEVQRRSGENALIANGLKFGENVALKDPTLE